MYRNKKIFLVIPAYNEERFITHTPEGVPPLIDRGYVADDASPDRQAQVVLDFAKKDPRVTLLGHTANQGPGAGIITGYRQSAADGYNQVQLSEAANFLDPLIDGRADYTMRRSSSDWGYFRGRLRTVLFKEFLNIYFQEWFPRF